MNKKFKEIIKYFIDNHDFLDVNVFSQFDSDNKDNCTIAKKLNAAFLIALSGDSHPSCRDAIRYLSDFETDPLWGKAAVFYKKGLGLVHDEISSACGESDGLAQAIDGLYSLISTSPGNGNNRETIDRMHKVFFPEGAGMFEDREESISRLRKSKEVRITRLNPSPVNNPAKEILFTSNILVTVPPPSKNIDALQLNAYLKQMLKRIISEEQLYWYDHPVPLGISPDNNEVLYGLDGLDKAIEFEKKRGTIHKNAKVTFVLSVSVTHRGIQKIVKEYLEEELGKEKNIQHLDVYIFTEADTGKLINDILCPCAGKLPDTHEMELLHEVIGVDGEYGRHYSFLKAIAAFWQVFIDPEIKGTFKIDLDQVFPQKELVEQSGLSAFEHLKTPLWGAEGVDSNGRGIEMGMIAGALVNREDISHSLFTPDVPFPSGQNKSDELVFFSVLPQAVSTEAEMMTRYTSDGLDGKKRCIQRVHVTGGTNGILINALRRYKPFTPAFIGRAEDQAYILSVLFDGPRNNLRYVHKDGLIMRHDKEAFAVEALKMAAAGKLIGDYIRTLMFSYYIKALPWSFNDIKKEIDPFTGCFVSRIPVTVVYLRFALKLAAFFPVGNKEKNEPGLEFFRVGTGRLHRSIQQLTSKPNPLADQFSKEKRGWDLFYNILDKAEEEIKRGDSFALMQREKAMTLIDNCRINFNSKGSDPL